MTLFALEKSNRRGTFFSLSLNSDVTSSTGEQIPVSILEINILCTRRFKFLAWPLELIDISDQATYHLLAVLVSP